MASEKPRLRKREIILAVSAGIVAAGGAALFMEGMDDSGEGRETVVVESGPSEMEYEVAPFEEVTTVGPQDVVISYGEEFAVRAEGSPGALQQLEVVVEGESISIRPKDDLFQGNWGSLESATFYITTPNLSKIALAGTGDIKVDRVEGESFEGIVGGPGEISIGDLQVERASFIVAGAGSLSVSGVAQETDVTIGGAGEVDAAELTSESAMVSIGGTGDVTLTVNDEADVSITGTGDVDILGPAQCSVTRMGVGNVSCEGGGGD